MPDDKKQHFERPTMYKQDFPIVRRTLYLLGVVAVTLFSGALGFMLMTLYFFPTGNPIITPISSPSGILINDPLTLPVRFDSRSLSIGILKRSLSYATGNEAYDALIDPATIEGVYAAMTSDGWFVGHGSISAPTGLLMVINGKAAQIEDVRVDSESGLVFVKAAVPTTPVTVSDNHPVPGERVVSPVFDTIVSYPSIFATVGRTYNVNDGIKNNYVKKTSSFSDYVELVQVENLEDGQLFFGQNQELVGLVVDNQLIPGWEVRQSFERLLREDREPLDLGVFYIESYRPFATEGTEGVTLYNPLLNAVPVGSLGRSVGLQVGDRIVKVNGEELSSMKPFRKLWTSSEFTDRITLDVIRGGELFQVSVER